MADERVGPIDPSGHDAAVDQTRPTDYANLTTTSLSELKAMQAKGAGKKKKLTPLEKQALTRLTSAVMTESNSRGNTPNDTAAHGLAAYQSGLDNLEGVTGRHIASIPGEEPDFGMSKTVLMEGDEKERRAELAQSATVPAQIAGAFDEFSGVMALWRYSQRPDFEPDLTFDYMSIRDNVERGLDADNREYLRESVSEADLKHRLERLEQERMNFELIGAHGSARAMAVGLVGGGVDPVGFAAGFGIGKVAQLTGVGARVAYANGQVGRALSYGAMEGVAGNMLFTATLDAAGEHTTYQDYAYAAAFGAGFGVGGTLLARPGAAPRAPEEAVDAHVADALGDVQAGSVRGNYELYTRAQEQAGPHATPEQIQVEADRIMMDEASRVNAIRAAAVPEQDRLFPTFTRDDYDPETGTIRGIEEAVGDSASLQRVQQDWGMTDAVIADPARRSMLSAIALRVEQWNARNPFDETRLASVMGRIPWLSSTGLTLARSQNAAARWVSGALVESTTGGSRASRTAAIDKALLERQYMETLRPFEDAYRGWRNKQEGNSAIAAVRDIIGSDMRDRFNKMLAREREARRVEAGPTTSDPHILRAADILDGGYGLMGGDMVRVGALGAARIAGKSARGYSPRHLNGAWLRNATNQQVAKVSELIETQLAGQWADFTQGPAIAKRVAANMIDRAKSSSAGMTPVPTNLASPEASEVIRDALRAMAVPDDQMQLLLGRFSRGGANFTKSRLDLDLSARVDLPNGQSFDLIDAFQNDHTKLYMQYARRASGEVALTKYGVMGKQGMKQIRDVMQFGPNGKAATDDELAAFDQIAAEFFGEPVGNAPPNRYLDMFRMLTASSRLGGMVFTQFVESSNAVGALGVKAALTSIKDIPRHINDVRLGKPNELLDSIELVGGPLGQDHRVIFPYQEAADIRVYGKDQLTALDRMVRAGSNAVPWISGWHHMHSAQVRGISEQIVHKMFRYIREGKDDVALNDMGITKDMASRIRNDLGRIAQFDDKGNLVALDITKGADSQAMATVVQSVHRGGRQIIQGTFIGETGKWAHHDLLRIMTQFRTFSITSMEKQWTRQRVNLGTAKAFGLLAGTMAFALPVHLARVQFNAAGREDRDEYLEKQLAPDMLARAVLNYVSLSGVAGDVLDAGAAVAGYEMSGVRGGGKNFLDNVPALGYINSTAAAVIEKDPRDAIRALPGGNLPWLMPLFNQAN